MKNRPRRDRRVRRRVSPLAAEIEAVAEFLGRGYDLQDPPPQREPVQLAGPAPESLRAFVRHGI